jgi:hypothetical protein
MVEALISEVMREFKVPADRETVLMLIDLRVNKAISDMIDRGDICITLDWKLRLHEEK